MTDTLQTLLERLENADGPDREIDETIQTSLVEEWPELGGYYGWERRAPGYISKPLDSEGRRHVSLEAPHYTASLDSSIELVEKVRPDWKPGIIAWSAECMTEPNDRVFASLCEHKNGSKLPTGGHAASHHATPALAMLTALVQALIAEQE